MKNLKYIFLLLFGLNWFGSKLHAQVDTLFWFAAPWVTPDHHWRDPIAFHFSTFGNPTTIRLQQPVTGYDTTFVVAANSLFSKTVHHMMNTIESKPANTILPYGFKITSDFPITIVYDVITRAPQYYNPETFSLKGQNGLGTEFVASFQTRWNNQTLGGDLNGDGIVTQPYQQINLVATEDNTVIYITPRCNVVGGHPANVTYSVTLPLKGQCYTIQNMVQNTSVPGNNLAGTVIVASNPIAVTVTDDSVNPSGGGGCFDLMGDQTVPTDVIGKDYIVLKGFLNAGSEESCFITATENFTTVTINDGTATTVILNQGDTYRYQLLQPRTSVSADKNVYVLHMTGYGCELGKAILPPLNCSGSDIVTFPRTNPQNFSLNILCPTGAEGGFLLNGSGALVPAGSFNAVPGTGGQWMAAQLTFTTAQIASGSSNILTNSIDNFGLGIINGGTSTGCLYHYMSSFIRRVYTNAGNDQTVCSGEPVINLSGTVEGGSTTGIWNVLDGSGTLATPTNLTTTYTPTTSDYTQGTLTFVLQSTGNCEPVADTMRVTFIQSPVVDAGTANIYCKNNITDIPVSGTLQFAAGATWTGGNGGAFANNGALSTTYTPSPADLSQDSLVLILTSAGSFFACPNDVDTLVVFFTDPPMVNAGANQVLCANTPQVNISGSVSGATTTGTWSTFGGGTFSPAGNLNTVYNVNPTDTTNGIVYLTLTSTNNGNCLAVRDSIEIQFVDVPFVAIVSEDTVCANVGTVNLDGAISSGYTPLWNTNGAGSIASNNSLSTVYSVSPIDTTAGFIQIYLSTNAGICPAQTDTMILVFATPPVAFAGIDQAFCANEVVQLNGVITGVTNTGTWTSTGTGTFNPGANFLTTTYTPSPLDVLNGGLDLILTSTNNQGCNPATDVMSITFKPAPLADFTASIECVGDNTIFNDISVATPNSVNSWNWNFGDLTTSIAQNPLHPYTASGTFTVTLIAGSSNGCYDTIQKQVTVNPLPIANFTVNTPCEGSPVTFTDQSFISTGAVTQWDYDFGDGSAHGTNQVVNHVFPGTGTFNVTLEVTSALGCSDTVIIPVTIIPRPNAAFTMSPNPVLALEAVQFTDLSSGTTPIIDWYWNFGDSAGINQQNPTHVYNNGGVYYVDLIVTDQNSCTDTARNEMIVTLLPAVPSGFTPNGDGENDVFRVRGGPFESIVFRVYNSWGQLIFSTTDQNEGWDGTFKGEDQPMGVYTWTVEVVITGGKVFNKTGDVTLMR